MSRGKRPARYYEFRQDNNDHRWRVTGGNGKPMSGSLEGYRRAKRMRESAVDAAVAVLQALAPERLK